MNLRILYAHADHHAYENHDLLSAIGYFLNTYARTREISGVSSTDSFKSLEHRRGELCARSANSFPMLPHGSVGLLRLTGIISLWMRLPK